MKEITMNFTFGTSKMKSNQTISEALIIQEMQLKEWESILKPMSFFAIKNKIDLENSKYSEFADGDVVSIGKRLDMIFNNHVEMINPYIFNQKDYSKFTVEKGIAIQRTNLKNWQEVLDDEYFIILNNYCLCENSTLSSSCSGYEVFRGQDINGYVRDLASDVYKEKIKV